MIHNGGANWWPRRQIPGGKVFGGKTTLSVQDLCFQFFVLVDLQMVTLLLADFLVFFACYIWSLMFVCLVYLPRSIHQPVYYVFSQRRFEVEIYLRIKNVYFFYMMDFIRTDTSKRINGFL